MRHAIGLMALLMLAACSDGAGDRDADAGADVDVEGEGEAVEIVEEDLHDEDAAEVQDDAGDDAADGEDGMDAGEDAAIDWVRYDGEVPGIAVFEKADHIASCMRTRACAPENPQQLATCTSAYAHIVGREIGISLQWVAACVNSAGSDCGAVRACSANGSEPGECVPLETPDRCEGSVMFQCSRASALTFSFDCAHVGMDCFVDDSGASRCGLGVCERGNFWMSCSGDTMVICEEGVITVADCRAAGLVCVESADEQGRCAGAGEPCDEEEVGRECDGDMLTGCMGGRMGEIDCSEVIRDWTCGPATTTLGCVVPGDECWAYPLLGSSIEEDCDGDGDIITCLDGTIITMSCTDYGLGPCTDLGTAARCTPVE
ncbi:MAG: hypothetical protein ABIJ56_18100 [Pseudomonadota bacterium]